MHYTLRPKGSPLSYVDACLDQHDPPWGVDIRLILLLTEMRFPLTGLTRRDPKFPFLDWFSVSYTISL